MPFARISIDALLAIDLLRLKIGRDDDEVSAHR
jgi:hypothetical protein